MENGSGMEARQRPPHERLREWRLSRNLTQQALAQLLGCAHPTVCKIELARQKPGRDLAFAIEDAAGIPPRAWKAA